MERGKIVKDQFVKCYIILNTRKIQRKENMINLIIIQ